MRFLDKKLLQALNTNTSTTRPPGSTLAAAFSSKHVDIFLPCVDNVPSTSSRDQPAASLARPYLKKISRGKNTSDASKRSQEAEERAQRAVERARSKAATSSDLRLRKKHLAELQPPPEPKESTRLDPQAVRKRTARLLVELRKEHEEITARIRASLNNRQQRPKKSKEPSPEDANHCAMRPPAGPDSAALPASGCPAKIQSEYMNLSVVDEDANWSVSAYVPPVVESHAVSQPRSQL